MGVKLPAVTRAWFHSGFTAEDNFDAMAGLFHMLQVLRGETATILPASPGVPAIEGWVLGCDGSKLGG